MLKEKISKVEKQMREALAEVRATFDHTVNKGTSIEGIFGQFLAQYLPRSLAIGNGEIIDSKGSRSGQVDIVIVNDDHPFTFTPHKPGLFFIEGVSAAGEVKTILTSQELTKTLINSVKYKKLQRAQSNTTIQFTNESDFNRFYGHPPFFLFAYESQISLDTIKANIEEYSAQNTIGQTEIIDAVFVLDKGWTINFGDGQGSYKFKTPDGQSMRGWVVKQSDTVLFDFFGYISVTMPKVIRFEPILAHYVVSKD